MTKRRLMKSIFHILTSFDAPFLYDFYFLFKYNNLHKSLPIYFMTIFEAKISKKLPKRLLFKHYNCHKTEYWR